MPRRKSVTFRNNPVGSVHNVASRHNYNRRKGEVEPYGRGAPNMVGHSPSGFFRNWEQRQRNPLNLAGKRQEWNRTYKGGKGRKQKGRGHCQSKAECINDGPITPSDGPILPEDILFKDEDVCILNPDVKKGILIFTNYTQPKGMTPVCKAGIKTGRQLKSEGVNFGRSMIHDYIFFRAPYFSDQIDYESIHREIESSFGKKQSAIDSRVWIRVDPDNSYVYSSEIRANFSPTVPYGSPEYVSAMENEVRKSKKSMTEYLEILGENEKEISTIEPGKMPLYHLFSSKVGIFPIRLSSEGIHKYTLHRSLRDRYPWNTEEISSNSEVLVRVPHLTPKYFVKCT